MALLTALGQEPTSGVTTAEANSFADNSVALLRSAVQAGWSHLAKLKESGFDAVRDRPDFQQVLADLEAKMPPSSETAPPPPEKK